MAAAILTAMFSTGRVIFPLVILTLGLRVTVTENIEEEDELLPYCMLGEDDGRSTFQLGNDNQSVCNLGWYFDYNPQNKGRPLGCRRCTRDKSFTSHRNFCPSCQECRKCSPHSEIELKKCTIREDTVCVNANFTNGTIPWPTEFAESTVASDVTSSPRQTMTIKQNSTATSPPLCTSMSSSEPSTESRTSSTLTNYVIALSVTCVILLLVIGGLVICICKLRREKKKHADVEHRQDDEQNVNGQNDPNVGAVADRPASSGAEMEPFLENDLNERDNGHPLDDEHQV
ncbi:tumor necrosis factor receptor superfamily member 1A-like [Acanthaster planci]|uniref:Tumor necrosis factor receptor superfamily member 1A-like n=1 Tax=Acanthaster planci TaxID=133434 RepID=A0A8B7YB60_ACAPL|nr:tumor necrosis factor receptor superfamily member 1A-like [Acanthaster planci]XP_022090474.1 tumor necrosis factor receptor superfamily member 1A-like [Acanthaster planci]